MSLQPSLDMLQAATVRPPSNQTYFTDWMTIPGVRYTMVTLHLIVILAAALGNGFLVYFIIRNWRQTKKNVTAWLVLNLAVCDLVNTTLHQPLRLVDMIKPRAGLGDSEIFCQVGGFFTCYIAAATFLTIVAIAMERYLLICHPLRAKSWLTMRNTWIVLSVIWGVSFITVLPFPIMFHYTVTVPLQHINATFCLIDVFSTHGQGQGYFIFLFLMYYALPVCVITAAYTRIFKVLYSSGVIRSAKDENAQRMMRTRRSLAKMMLLIAGMFAVCEGPFFFTFLLASAGVKVKRNPIFLLIVVEFLPMISAVLNPVVYSLRAKTFRKGVTTTSSSLSRKSTLRTELPPESPGPRTERTSKVQFTSQPSERASLNAKPEEISLLPPNLPQKEERRVTARNLEKRSVGNRNSDSTTDRESVSSNMPLLHQHNRDSGNSQYRPPVTGTAHTDNLTSGNRPAQHPPHTGYSRSSAPHSAQPRTDTYSRDAGLPPNRLPAAAPPPLKLAVNSQQYPSYGDSLTNQTQNNQGETRKRADNREDRDIDGEPGPRQERLSINTRGNNNYKNNLHPQDSSNVVIQRPFSPTRRQHYDSSLQEPANSRNVLYQNKSATGKEFANNWEPPYSMPRNNDGTVTSQQYGRTSPNLPLDTNMAAYNLPLSASDRHAGLAASSPTQHPYHAHGMGPSTRATNGKRHSPSTYVMPNDTTEQRQIRQSENPPLSYDGVTPVHVRPNRHPSIMGHVAESQTSIRPVNERSSSYNTHHHDYPVSLSSAAASQHQRAERHKPVHQIAEDYNSVSGPHLLEGRRAYDVSGQPYAVIARPQNAGRSARM